MKTPFNTRILASLTVLALAGFLTAPVADARNVGGGGGKHAGARSGGGHQINNSKSDARSNNVRSTSNNTVNRSSNRSNVNVRNTNVNVNKNVNVDVDHHGGCCHGGWDDDYHPIATAAAVTATVAITSAVIGSIVNTMPPGCVPVNYGGIIYQQCGSSWYQPQGNQYIVVNPPY